jgi:prevent-host-death family protein
MAQSQATLRRQIMQTETIELDEAQAHFGDLVHRVVSGIHVVLSENHKPIAHLLPAGGRVPGLHAGTIWTGDDFDAPLPDEFWASGK